VVATRAQISARLENGQLNNWCQYSTSIAYLLNALKEDGYSCVFQLKWSYVGRNRGGS